MKNNTKARMRTTLLVLFPILLVGLIGCFIFFFIFNGKSRDFLPAEYYTKTLAEMKVGERIRFSEVCPEYALFEKENKGGKFLSRHQYARTFYTSDYEDDLIFLDEQGYLHARKTGLYTFKYVVREAANEETIPSPDATYREYNFSCDIAVYEHDEKDYTPWNNALSEWDENGSYILTENIEVSASLAERIYEKEFFYGIIINPYGYTVETDYQPALLNINEGIVDGLKLKVNKTSVSDFSAFATINGGLIKNCTSEGSATVQNTYWQTAPINVLGNHSGGYCYNNTVRMTLYADAAHLRPLGDGGQAWKIRDNQVYLDAYYANDALKCGRRNAAVEEKAEPLLEQGNIVRELDGSSPDYSKMHTVTVKTSWAPEIRFIIPDRGKLEVSRLYEESILGWSEETGVRHWLVDGKKYESLKDIRVTKDLVLEPDVKYRETKYFYGETEIVKIHNAEKEIVLPTQYKYYNEVKKLTSFAGEIFDELESDPFAVQPTRIVIPKELSPTLSEVFSDASAEFVRSFLRRGGALDVDDEHSELVLIDKRNLCTADGRTLLRYFDAAGETEFSAHPLIRKISSHAFLEDNELKNFDVSDVETFDTLAFFACKAAESFKFGKTLQVVSAREQAPDLLLLLCGGNAEENRLGKLRTVEIDKANPSFYVEDGSVISRVNQYDTAALVYYPVARAGTVRIPEGVQIVTANAFTNGIFTELILPDSLTRFYTESVSRCQSLERIEFGDSQTLRIEPDTHRSSAGADEVAESLQELVFGSVKNLYFDEYAFPGVEFDVLTLPASLERYSGAFKRCSAFAISSAGAYETVDGVLYDKAEKQLQMYPLLSDRTEFVIPEGTLAVADLAFRSCLLTSVTFPDGLQSIGEGAFGGCPLEQVRFGKGLRKIDAAAFSGCGKLVSVELGESEEGLEIGDYAFSDCKSLQTFGRTDSLVSLGKEVFSYSGVTEFVFPAGLQTIGESCFENSLLERAVFDDGCKASIPEHCFSSTPLSEVVLGGVTEVGRYAFYNCASLSKVDLSGIVTLQIGAFEGSGITEVKNETITRIESGTFRNCKALKSVCLPNVGQIGSMAFSGCKELWIAELPVCRRIESDGFAGCEKLETFTSAELNSVGQRAFENCVKLTGITFCEGLEAEIGERAFSGCSGLASLLFKSGVRIGVSAFEYCTSLKKVSIGGGSVFLGDSAFKNCTALTEINIEAGEGAVSASAFFGVKTPLDVYLNIDKNFVWEGKVAENITLYVPEALRRELLKNWLVNSDQLIAYDFGDNTEPVT